jgi:hypothetical protein
MMHQPASNPEILSPTELTWSTNEKGPNMVDNGPALSIVDPRSRREWHPRRRCYPREFIVNKINYFNFQQLPLIARLEHAVSGVKITRPAYPSPCLRHQLYCAWPTACQPLPEDLDEYRLKEILIPDGCRLFAFSPQQSQVSSKGLRFALPDTCEDGNRRYLKRHTVSGVKALVDDGQWLRVGRLVNFNAESFLIRLGPLNTASKMKLHPGKIVNLSLREGHNTCYTGPCRVISQAQTTPRDGLVLAPLNEPVQCLEPKRHRCERYQPDLRPDVTYSHPLLKRPQVLKAEDLSGGGFAVCEPITDSVLPPGMRIHDLVLRFQDCDSIQCEVLVVYRNRDERAQGGEPKVRCGLVITDISPEDHTRLLAYLTHARNQRTYACNPVEMDALWHFFFETGFIYPEKYAGFGEQTEKIKSIYKRLYLAPSNISRHFIYQEDGVILGHVAGIRAYEDSWMIHHLAANTSISPVAGLAVLKQVGHFLMAASNLASNRLKYILNYYQAEKKFSRRIWGEVTRRIDAPQNCCEYILTYLRIHKRVSPLNLPQESYKLHPCQRKDLVALQKAYRPDHGDLMLAALDLVPERISASSLSDEYQRMQFHRSRRLYAIKSGAKLEAVCMVIQTDAGLNMSDLINNIQVLIMPDSEMPAAALQQILQTLAEPFEQEDVAVLLYPSQYAEEQRLDGERQYTLWILDTNSSDDYFNYINRIMRFA